MPTTDSTPAQNPAQVGLRAGRYTATTTALGAALARLRHDDRDLVLPSGGELGRPAYEGAICAPWPNRVVDGSWEHAGEHQQLALNERDLGHALHGFVHDREWTLLEATEDTVRWVLHTPPRTGYPWALTLVTAYHLDAEGGLTWEVTAQQQPAEDPQHGPAPYGVTAHPYFVAGSDPADSWSLELPAEAVLTVDERLVPQDRVSVRDAGLDFRAGRLLGDQQIDHAFGGLTARTARLTSPEGTGVEVSWDERSHWVQIFTAQWDARHPRHAIALEPMTCPPDAFNSGTDLVWLTERPVTVRWQVRAL